LFILLRVRLLERALNFLKPPLSEFHSLPYKSMLFEHKRSFYNSSSSW
jgi:hypothetical protein